MHQYDTRPFRDSGCFWSQTSNGIFSLFGRNYYVLQGYVDFNPSLKQIFYFMISSNFPFPASLLAAVVDDNYRDDQLNCIDGFWPDSGSASWHLSLARDKSHVMRVAWPAPGGDNTWHVTRPRPQTSFLFETLGVNEPDIATPTAGIRNEESVNNIEDFDQPV